MSLFNETGHPHQDARNSEAIRLIEEISVSIESLGPTEQKFVNDMSKRVAEGNLYCSAKQLFWLRDLYQKYVVEG